MGKDIHVAFPDHTGVWYLVPHDELVAIIGNATPWLESNSWQTKGWYSSARPSRALRAAIQQIALGDS